jgi:sigma-B regulation protein RsbU (phosphoserine phosphatase)
VPLSIQGRQTGVLYVDSTATAKEFTEGDRAVFEALAGIAATAIEQTRLAVQEAERKRLQSEVDVARRIQLSLMPRDVVAPAGWDVACEGRGAVETSGDYHDVIPLEDGSVALVVGDVSGHGLGAALFMASVRALLRTLLHTSRDPIAVFRGLNAYLCRDMPAESFMSLFLGLLDAKASTLEWVSAGHNPPLHVRHGAPVVELERTGPVLGVLPDAPYRRKGPIALAPGDAVVLYTDGIYEARDAAGEIYGEERFQASVRAHAERDARARPLIEGVLADLEGFVGSRPFDDDITCVVVRALPKGVPSPP